MGRIQLKSSVLLIPKGQRALLRHRTSERILLVESPGLDAVALCERLTAGCTEDDLLAEFAGNPSLAGTITQILDSLRGRGFLIDFGPEADSWGESETIWFSRALAYFADFETEDESRFALMRRIRDSHVVMLGVGSLGSWAMLYLATSGVGRLTVVDNDIVEPSNLSRQVAYGCDDLGRSKVLAAMDSVRRVTPHVDVVPCELEITSPEDIEAVVRDAGEADLLVLTADMPVWEISRWSALAARRTGVALLRGNSLGIGPLFIGDDTACPGCDWPRLVEAQPGIEDTVAYYRDLFLNGRRFSAASALSTNISVAGAVLAQEALLYLAGRRERCQSINHRIRVNHLLACDPEPFPKDERCEECGPTARGNENPGELRYGELVSTQSVEIATDEAIGPFLKAHAVVRHPRLPISGGQRHLAGHGFGLDVEVVKRQALAELVEHLSAFYSGLDARPFVRGSHADLCMEHHLIDLESLARYEDADDAPEDLRPDERITWTPARQWSSGDVVLVPALLSYLSWRPPRGERIFAYPDATGLAAHRTREHAALHGWREVVERDASMLSWKVPGWPVAKIDPDRLPPAFRKACYEVCESIQLFDIGREDGPSVILAIASQRNGNMTTCGTACRETLEAAAVHAVEEALMLRLSVLRTDAGDADPARPDTSLGHVRRCFERGGEILSWYEGLPRDQREFRAADATSMASGAVGNPLIVDVTDARARSSGWTVVRAIVPTAQPRESMSRAQCVATPALKSALERHAGGRGPRRDPHPFG